MAHPAIEVRSRSLLERIWLCASLRIGVPRRPESPELQLFARLEDRIAGSLTIIRRSIIAADQRITVAGLGNVLTRPEYRRRGVASAMLDATADLMRTRLNREFGVLMCRREVAPLYEKKGWIRVDGPTMFRQSGGVIACPDDTMVLKLDARDWPDGPIDLCGIPW